MSRGETAAPGVDVMVFLPRLDGGGVARATAILCTGLAGRGVRVSVATLGRGRGRVRPLIGDGVRLHRLDAVGAEGETRGPVQLITALAPLAAAIRSVRPRVLLSPGNHAHVFAVAAHGLACRPATALVLKITNPIVKPAQPGWLRWLRTRVYRAMLARAASVLVLSASDAAAVARIAPASAHKLKVVHNPYVDVSPPVGPVAPPAGEAPLILAVGRLTRQKNFELLLEALSHLRGERWRLAVLGAGRGQPALSALAGRLGLADRVSFPGYVPDPRAYYRAAAMLAMSSRWEGLPAVAIEAMAVGCPVVATDCSAALSEMVRASATGLIAPQTAAGLAAAIGDVLARPRPRAPVEGAFAYTVANGVESHLAAMRGLWIGEGAPDRSAPIPAALLADPAPP